MDECDEYTKLLKRIDADTGSVSNDKSDYSAYISKNFKTVEDALEFLNAHHIDTNDVVSLLKLGGNFSASIFKLIFFDRIKTEKYSIVAERYIRRNPSLLKDIEEVFNTEDRHLAEANFEHYLLFESEYSDEYEHVYVLKRNLEWMSGRKITTDINRFDPKSYHPKDVQIIDHPLLIKERQD